MHETPITDELLALQREGFSDEAVSALAETAFDGLRRALPEYFDRDGMPYNLHAITIATTSNGTYPKNSEAD